MVALLLGRVVAVLGPRVRRSPPLLVAIVTVLQLGGGALRLAELQTDLPVLLLHLADPRLQRGSLQDSGRRGVGQAGGQEEGATICGGEEGEFDSGRGNGSICPDALSNKASSQTVGCCAEIKQEVRPNVHR